MLDNVQPSDPKLAKRAKPAFDEMRSAPDAQVFLYSQAHPKGERPSTILVNFRSPGQFGNASALSIMTQQAKVMAKNPAVFHLTMLPKSTKIDQLEAAEAEGELKADLAGQGRVHKYVHMWLIRNGNQLIEVTYSRFKLKADLEVRKVKDFIASFRIKKRSR